MEKTPAPLDDLCAQALLSLGIGPEVRGPLDEALPTGRAPAHLGDLGGLGQGQNPMNR